MATGGRVLHHLKASLPDSRNTVLLVGFQAEGTRGRHLLNGEKTIRIHGIDVPVHAHVDSIDSMSAHADSTEILRWLRGFKTPPTRTFIVHGEPTAMQALHTTISTELRWDAYAPQWKETVELT
jgi:metallo-beta-lactamase family protein